MTNSLAINGTLSSKFGTSYIIDFYASATIGASGQAQAQDYLSSIKVTTNASGLAIFSKTFAVSSNRTCASYPAGC